ncbi:hypothetical protein GCK72_012581 [Caenorhabditis remanei]|uniref:Uncharacterized protein n=1 Tax=Caenorhabditis remanei TaxID=31234 RepID=A0A6A5GLC4_CAERE|nr:hypothetical protein GCK72_012581 [Caenorhabditis remanei]KAF1756128.1 hypothetical protein GCK72_012581 [Caenorhabditis remanei]
MDPSEQRQRDSERDSNEESEEPRSSGKTIDSSDQDRTAHAEPNRGVKQERSDEQPGTSHPTGSRIKVEPVEEVPESPRENVAPRERTAAPFQFKSPRLESRPLSDVSRGPQMEDPLVAAQKRLDLKQQRIDTLKQRLKDQERELTLKFAEQLKKKEKELTLKHDNELLSQKVKYLEEINQKEQQINELLKNQFQQNQQQPTMAVSQYMVLPSQFSAPPGPANPTELVVAPAPRAPNLADPNRKTSVMPRDTPMKPVQQNEQRNKKIEHQVKERSSQSLAGLNHKRDLLESDAPEKNNLRDYEIRNQQMDIEGVPDEVEPNEGLDLSNERPVGDQVANDLPHLTEQPEVEAAHEEPMEEDDDIAPLQNEVPEENVENNEGMDVEEPEIQPAGGLRRSAPKKKPVSLMKLRHEKKNIRFHYSLTMDANGQRDSDVESERAWPSPAPNVPQFRLPNAKVPKKRVRQESDQPGTAHAAGSRIKEEPIAEESSRRNNRERSHQAHSSGARIKAEPAEETPELDRPPCEYTPQGSVVPSDRNFPIRAAVPSQFKPPRLDSHSLDDVAPQMEDPLLAAQKLLNLKQQRIDTLKQRLKDQERELTLKFEEQLKKKEKELTLKHDNELLSQKVKYLEEINQKEQQINELLKSQVHQNQQQPTMPVPQYMMPAPPLFMPTPPTSSARNFTVPVPDSIHPNVPNPPQLVAPAPCPQASIPAPRAASPADSGRKTSVAPRESSSESMEPPQKKMRRDDREMDHQVKDRSSQSYVGLNQERDLLDSNREDNLQDYEVGDQPEEPQIQRFDESGDQRMEIGGVPDVVEPNDDQELTNEPPVGNQEEIEFPDLGMQPEMEAAHEEPMEENDEMGPPQNEGLELDGNGEVQPAIGRRRSAREKHPVSLIQPKYGKNHIKNQRQGEHKRYKALHGGSYRKNKRRCKKRTDPTDV